MDYSALSDDELRQMVAQKRAAAAPPPPKAYGDMTDDELRAAVEAKRSQTEPPGPDKIIEEMHPELTAMDRFKVKNFSNDPKTAAAFLAHEHPGLEVKEKDGRILARGKGEKDYRVLDPDTPLFSMATLKDLPQDALDLAYDVPAGVAQAFATGAGGLAGNIPGAMATGAASGAGLETLRQAIGTKLGINNGVSGGDIALSGGLGALAPLLFGSGVGAKEATKALGRGAFDVLTEGEQATLKGQEGLLKKAVQYAGQNAGAIADKAGEAMGKVGPVGRMAAGAAAGELLGHDEGHKAALLGAALTSPVALRALEASGSGLGGIAEHIYDNQTPAVMSAWQALLQRKREGQ